LALSNTLHREPAGVSGQLSVSIKEGSGFVLHINKKLLSLLPSIKEEMGFRHTLDKYALLL